MLIVLVEVLVCTLYTGRVVTMGTVSVVLFVTFKILVLVFNSARVLIVGIVIVEVAVCHAVRWFVVDMMS